MNILWKDKAWLEHLYWQTQDKKTLRKINNLLKDIDRNGYNCTGKPEPLRDEFIMVTNNQKSPSATVGVFFVDGAEIFC